MDVRFALGGTNCGKDASAQVKNVVNCIYWILNCITPLQQRAENLAGKKCQFMSFVYLNLERQYLKFAIKISL